MEIDVFIQLRSTTINIPMQFILLFAQPNVCSYVGYGSDLLCLQCISEHPIFLLLFQGLSSVFFSVLLNTEYVIRTSLIDEIFAVLGQPSHI